MFVLLIMDIVKFVDVKSSEKGVVSSERSEAGESEAYFYGVGATLHA